MAERDDRATVAAESVAVAPSAPAMPVEVWTTPEPLGKRLFRAAKVWLIASVTHFSLMPLLADTTVRPGQSLFIGFWGAALSFVGSRTGTLLPASPMLVFGGVTIGVGALVGAVTIVKGAGLGEATMVSSIALFLGGIMLWMGLKARRAERALAEGQRAEHVAPVLVTRAELAARIEANQVEQDAVTQRMMRRLTVGMVAVLGIAVLPYERILGAPLPEAAGAALFFSGWGAAGLLARSVSRRMREVAARLGLVCSACDQTYSGAFANQRYFKNIVEIGRCPQCGARIVTEDGR